MFANPLGLLTLLAIPAILAIHFLQRKSISLPVSTLFLLERTQREAVSGRRFERLLPSVPLWMQLLAVLLLTWFLSEPRFQKENSVQRVAVVVDSSASMSVFKNDAVEALKAALPDLKGEASTLELTLLPSNPGDDRIYAGTSTEDMLSELQDFTPDRGVIDPSYTLRLARSIVSNDGIVIYLTDTPVDPLPYDSRLISVGRPIANVGFTGVSFGEKQGALTFRAIVKNYGTTNATRTWALVTETAATEPRQIEIKPGAFATIQAAFPENADRVRLELSADEFSMDDVLPMVAPQPKTISIFTATSPAFRDLTEKLLRSIAGAQPSNDAAESDLIISSYDPLDPRLPENNTVLFVEDPSSAGKYLSGGIITESHPLIDGINWQSLLVRETLQLPRKPEDKVLLWQGKRPLIFIRRENAASILCFNFDLRLSNATQQPAFIVLLHRFTEMIRERKVAPQNLNLETGQPIQIATAPDQDTAIRATNLSGKALPAPPLGRAPTLPSFLTVTQGDLTLLTAAVHFADTREADFTETAPGEGASFSSTASLKLHTAPDPFARIWIALLLTAIITAWYFTAGKARNPATAPPTIPQRNG